MFILCNPVISFFLIGPRHLPAHKTFLVCVISNRRMHIWYYQTADRLFQDGVYLIMGRLNDSLLYAGGQNMRQSSCPNLGGLLRLP